MPVNVFGNGAVQTAYVNYRLVDLTVDSQVLVWPTSYVDTPDTLAAAMNVDTPEDDDTRILTLPDAREASVGQNFIITNIGASTFRVTDNNGDLLITPDTGVSYWFLLTDTTTAAGTWTVLTYGAGESAADANLLAGPGLIASGTKLNTNIPVMSIGAAYNVLPADVAKLIIYIGGASTITLPAAGTVPVGFYVSFNNEGTGELNLVAAGGLTIDNQANIAVELNQSLSVIWDGTEWWTLGFGQSVFTSVNVLNKNVAGNLNVVLTPSESTFLIQQYTGVLTGNITIFFPDVTNYWYIANNTTGAFSLSIQLGTQAAPIGALYQIAQGVRQIFYSDGTSFFIIPSAPFGNDVVVTKTDDSTSLDIISPGDITLSLIAGDGNATIEYNGGQVMLITNTDVVNLNNPLPIGSGGTGQNTAPLAINALMPVSANGALAYYNGANWVTLAAGADGTTLKMAGGIPTWTA